MQFSIIKHFWEILTSLQRVCVIHEIPSHFPDHCVWWLVSQERCTFSFSVKLEVAILMISIRLKEKWECRLILGCLPIYDPLKMWFSNTWITLHLIKFPCIQILQSNSIFNYSPRQVNARAYRIKIVQPLRLVSQRQQAILTHPFCIIARCSIGVEIHMARIVCFLFFASCLKRRSRNRYYTRIADRKSELTSILVWFICLMKYQLLMMYIFFFDET